MVELVPRPSQSSSASDLAASRDLGLREVPPLDPRKSSSFVKLVLRVSFFGLPRGGFSSSLLFAVSFSLGDASRDKPSQSTGSDDPFFSSAFLAGMFPADLGRSSFLSLFPEQQNEILVLLQQAKTCANVSVSLEHS